MFQDFASSARNFGTWRMPRAASLFAWVVKLDAQHRDRIALSRLDDRLLCDVGLTRAEVEAEIGHPRPQAAGF